MGDRPPVVQTQGISRSSVVKVRARNAGDVQFGAVFVT